MCQVFIGKIISGETWVDKMQSSGSRTAYLHSKAHRMAAVLAWQSFRSEIVTETPEYITAQLTQIGACAIGQGESMAVVVTMTLSFGHIAGSEHG